jgi:hypothetical protein
VERGDLLHQALQLLVARGGGAAEQRGLLVQRPDRGDRVRHQHHDALLAIAVHGRGKRERE